MLREADTNIVLVLLSYQLLGGIRQKLVGSCIVGEREPFRSVALAVLKATNRIIGNVVSALSVERSDRSPAVRRRTVCVSPNTLLHSNHYISHPNASLQHGQLYAPARWRSGQLMRS